MKLFIGVGMASAAVALQNRFPWPSNAATAPLTTASINKQAKTAAPKAQSQRPERTFAGHTSAVNAAAYANNERTLVTAGADGSLKTWDAESGAPLRTMVLTDGPALSIAARGNRVLTSHRNGAVALWNLETGDKIATFKRNDAEVWSVAFIGNGERFAAASHDWKVAVWEIAAPAEPVQILSGHKNSAQVVAFGSTSRGSVIATGSADKTVKFWSSKSHKLLRTYRGHRDFVNHIAFSSDGRSLASASLDGNIRIWSTRSRRLYRSYKAHDGPVTGLAFSNDGRTLVSAGEDGQLRLWDIKRRSSKRTLTAEAGKLQSLALSKQAERLAAATASGQIQIWQLSTGAKVSAK